MLIELLFSVPVLLAPPTGLDADPLPQKPSLPAQHTFSKTIIRIIDSKRYINGDGPGPVARVHRLLKEERYIRYGEIFGGTVIELTEDTITVRNWSDFPRTFSVAPPLTSDRIPLKWYCGCGHRLADVRLGDKVGFFLAPTSRGPVVIALGIYRRPGGTIPPAEDSQLPPRCRIHNRNNAEQAVEEKILPKLSRKLLHFHP